MTKEEFIERRIQFEKQDRRSNAILLTVLFGGLAVAFVIGRLIPESLDWIVTTGVFVLMFVCLGIAFFGGGGMNQAKHHGLVCRACGGGLLNVPGDQAIETGLCSHCGGKPFDD